MPGQALDQLRNLVLDHILFRFFQLSTLVYQSDLFLFFFAFVGTRGKACTSKLAGRLYDPSRSEINDTPDQHYKHTQAAGILLYDMSVWSREAV